MHTDITIVKNIRDDAALRSSFNRLAEKTFDLNFDNWYQNGYWKENYIPYAAVREGQVIANVSVNPMTFSENGILHHYIQLGTVMTDSAFRSQGLCRLLMEAVEKEDVLAAFFIGNRSFMDRRTFLRMEEFGLESYRAVFAKSAVWVEDLFSFYRDRPLEVEKIALFFPSGNLNARDGLHRRAQACARVQERIHSLPVTMAVSASGNMEITGEGVNKGTGLKLLCGHLGLPLSQTAAVGDGENDRELLRLAGLAVAMENASASIRAAAAVTVPDCDHDGAAVAMERYML